MTTQPTEPSPQNPLDPSAIAPAAAPDLPPDHRDMYLLIAGLVVGLILSPWIMGRFVSDVAYEKWYYGGGEKVDDYHRFMKSHLEEQRKKDADLLDRLVATGVTKEAVDEMRARLAEEARQERLPYVEAIAQERKEHEQWQRGLMLALVAVLVILMLIEPVFEMTGDMAAVRRRMITARYGLVAAWLALALAKPHAMADIAWSFAGLLAFIILLATLLPLLLKRIASEARQG